jgi:hypothetical protein
MKTHPLPHHDVVNEVFEDFNRAAPISVDWDTFLEQVDLLYRKTEGGFPSHEPNSMELERVREIASTVGHSWIDDYLEFEAEEDEFHYVSEIAEYLRTSLEKLMDRSEGKDLLRLLRVNQATRKFSRYTVIWLEFIHTSRGILPEEEPEPYGRALDHLIKEGVCVLTERANKRADDVFKLVAV